jgi:hypothetical protein
MSDLKAKMPEGTTARLSGADAGLPPALGRERRAAYLAMSAVLWIALGFSLWADFRFIPIAAAWRDDPKRCDLCGDYSFYSLLGGAHRCRAHNASLPISWRIVLKTLLFSYAALFAASRAFSTRKPRRFALCLALTILCAAYGLYSLFMAFAGKLPWFT